MSALTAAEMQELEELRQEDQAIDNSLSPEEAQELEQLRMEDQQEVEQIQKAQVELNDISEVESFAVNTANQLLFGFGDEVAAGAESMFTTKTYEDALKENQEYLERTAQANPKSAMAGQITGGVAGSLAGGFGVGRLAGLAGKSIPKLGNIIIGTAEGAIAGMGNSEEQGVLNRLDEGLAGGMVGALGGAAGSLIGKGMSTVKREMIDSGEELIDKSMGIFNTTMRRRFGDFLERKGLTRKEFNGVIKEIKLDDGSRVFDGASSQAAVGERVGVKMKEISSGYDRLYTELSDEAGAIIDPLDAMVEMNSKFLNDSKISEILSNPTLKNQNKAITFMDDKLQNMFTSDKAVTIGQLHRKIKMVEAEAFAEFGVNPKNYFALPDTVKKGLKAARRYLGEQAESKLPEEGRKLFSKLNKEFSIVGDFGNLVNKASQYETKGAIAGLVKTIASHNSVLTGSIGAGVGASMGGDTETVMKYAAIGMTMKTLAKSPTINKAMGHTLEFVGGALAKGQLGDEAMKKIVNAATRSIEDFEIEVFNTSERMQGKLPTEEDVEESIQRVKSDPNSTVSRKLKDIALSKQKINPYMQEREEDVPFMRQRQETLRDNKGKKIEDEGIVVPYEGPTKNPFQN